ncbi:SH3 domain-containing RING finger protein 3 [Cynoglossus semilaevis]|uniref:SH3 domain-containing RING finger protein 3 n=1 Tax=Cynoglossus semilaevis TaxID=244447 RepID=UPI0007DCB089|nr:SH3 domain-containing RING finger protein 3 [Cynoglossus semilaevis]XP_024919725.1 SH3 domain-containing RING finger protein 3 [Cynoglossus semilaevis]
MLTLSGDMDDSSSLLDLLECSVCLERLDTTAKVLPCQHTFCRRCLENIISSRNELRCPECRILVDCGVDDLPANILLVRLLDGIKQRPQRGNGGGGGKQCAAAGSLQGYAAGLSASPPGSATRELPVATRSSPVKNIPALPCGKALYSYEGKEPGDLHFSKGDIIILRRKVDDNWYHGELNGCHGFLPASYIQLLRPLSQTPPQGKALYDFEVKDKDQDKDCLAFSKDEVLTVIRRVDENWAEGMLGDKIGIFPILYVELNETAKQLMEIDKPQPANVPGPSSEPAPLGPCSPGPSPGSSPSNGNGSSHRRGEGKKNAKKRHSFTALSVTHRAAQLNNRHSMEISHPVLISSSDPRAAARIQDASPPGPSPSSAGVQVPPKVASITSELLAHAKVQLPLNIYLALYAYKPQKADELELRKGEMYRVTEKCQDGWFKGTSLRTGASGVFPGNYVTPVSRAPFGVGSPRSSCLSSPVGPSGGGGNGCGQVGNKTSDPSSPGAPGPSLPRPSTPLISSANTISTVSPASSPQSAAAQLKNCLRSSQHSTNQARTSMQLVHSPPARSPERPTVAVYPLRSQSSSPSRCPGQSGRPHSMVSPGSSLGPSPLSSPASRPLLPLSSPLSCLTPPNVSAVLLNGEPVIPLQPPSPGPSHVHTQGTLAPKAEKKERKAGGLLKLLSGASSKKKPRSPPSSPPTHNPSLPGQCAVAPDAGHHPHYHHARSGSCPMVSQGRAGSCPVESDMGGAIGLEPLHRKSGSLDTNFPMSPPATRLCNPLMVLRPEPKPLSRERYRVVVPYPPQSEAEIELREGDVVFVHKKREDGWYKGTLQRTGQTGLFPSSFVESF